MRGWTKLPMDKRHPRPFGCSIWCRHCERCPAPLPYAKRMDSRYSGNACRQAAWRGRHAAGVTR